MDELLSEFAPREGGEDAVVTGPRCRLGVSGAVLRSRIMVRGGIAMMLQPQQLEMSEKMSHVERRVTPPRFVEVEHERAAVRLDHLLVVMVVVDRAAAILITDERARHAIGEIGNLGRRVPPLRQRRPLLGGATRARRGHVAAVESRDRKSTRLNSSHEWISYAVFCLK